MILALTLASLGLLQGRPVVDPVVGSPLRKAILDAYRPIVRKAVKKPFVFKVDWLRTNGTWAFFSGRLLQPDGRAFVYRGTAFQSAVDDGAFDDLTSALLKRSGKAWRVVEWQVGATDVPWDGAWKRHRAPRTIFPR